MENENLLEILTRIEILVKDKMSKLAYEYINIEIENLQGITPKQCKNPYYYYNFCSYCSNTNCPAYCGSSKKE